MLRRKLEQFNKFFKVNDIEGCSKFIEENNKDKDLIRAIKVQLALYEGFNQARKEMEEVIRKLTEKN